MSLETLAPSYCPAVYGPVFSRRHGKSLGINLGMTDKKICTWGCLYCQCGLGERRDIRSNEGYTSAKKILILIKEAVEKVPDLDSITFAGNSEPSVHPQFLELVQGVLDHRVQLGASWTVNCLSNGSELDQKDVIQACNLLDEAWFKLDCAIDELFFKLNRPVGRVGNVFNHASRFKNIKSLYLQTLVWLSPEKPIISNWTAENKSALLKYYGLLQPKMIHLTTIARIPAVSHLKPVPIQELNVFSYEIQKEGHSVQVYQ